MEKHFQEKLDALVARMNAKKNYCLNVTSASDTEITIVTPWIKCVQYKDDKHITVPSSVKVGRDRWTGKPIKEPQWTPGAFKKVIKEFANELAVETGKKVKIKHEQEARLGRLVDTGKGLGCEGTLEGTATLSIG